MESIKAIAVIVICLLSIACLADNAGSGNWKSGDRLQGNISDADLQEWIDSYK